jgi:hypothetical protein
LQGALFYVFSSFTGRPPWSLKTPLGTREYSFQDLDFTAGDQSLIPHYRVVATLDGKDFESPIIAAFDRLSRRQYGAVRAMLNLELKRMRLGNGLEVVQFIPLVDGVRNPAYSPTGQQIGMDKPGMADPSYGMPFKGGFSPGLWTYIEIGAKTMSEQDRQDGTGTSQDITGTARMLAFPQPARGHMLVHPPTDERWVVTDKILPYSFKGVAVIAYDVTISLLNNVDPRYNVPVPPRP